MSDVCPVPSCGRPRPRDAHVCRGCGEDLGADLAALADLARELETTLARQGRTGQGHRAAPQGLPVDLRASTALADLHTLLEGWARTLRHGLVPVPGPVCARCRHHSCARITARNAASVPPELDQASPAGDGTRRASAPVLAAWLADRHHHLLRRPDAAAAVTQVYNARRTAEQIVDRAPTRWYAGPCDCGTPMYVQPGAAAVTCPHCETAHDVRERREWLLASIADRLTTATQAAHVITLLAVPITPERIWKWAERDLLIPHGHDVKGRPLYLIRDVMDLHIAMLVRQTERQAGKKNAKVKQ